MKRSRDDFYQDVYDVVRLVPPGRVTSYGAIAKYLGEKSAARMVGYAMNASFKQGDVPAHRVVNRNGQLSGKHHFPNENSMQERLEAEGVRVVEDQIEEFKRLFWDPVVELGSF